MNSVMPLAPVAAIIQQQQKSWTQIVDEIAVLAQSEDQNALRMGDLFVEVADRFGKKLLKDAAEQAGISWNVARQRHWVSSKIPKENNLRAMPLSFTHLRALADTEDMEGWAQQAMKNGWTANQLREKIGQAEDNKAIQAGQPCIHCNEPLPTTGEVVSFNVGHRGRARCCNIEHAIAYLQELLTEGGDEGETENLAGIVLAEELFS